MNSILTNSAALSALQSLNQTQNDMSITQNQVSTGLAVATAADNAAYWSIGQQLTSANGITTAANTALQQSQAIMDTANSAISSVITTIDAIQSALTEASNPGASFKDINSTLSSLSSQLTQAINGASFNGVNLINGSQSSTTAMSFVSGYDASASGGSVTSIGFTASALTGGQNAAGGTASSGPTAVTDSNLITQLQGLTNGQTLGSANSNGNLTASTVVIASNVITITSTNTAGDATQSTYTASAADGTAAANTQGFSANNPTGAASWTVATATTFAATPSPQGALIQTGTTALQGSYNLTQLGSATGSIAVTSTNASDMLSAVNQALTAVKSNASAIGAAQNAMTAASAFNAAVSTDYANGISSLVDADMNTASTRLQALQTQQQLGIQSLSIANQNSQLILKLFNG